MGVGLYLTGSYVAADLDHEPEDWLDEVATWIEGHESEPLMMCHIGEDDEGIATLFLQAHPCAEDVEVRVPAPGQVSVAAKTSTAGPGYHLFLCELIHQMESDFVITWDDPASSECGDDTGHFFKEDPDAVRAEMLTWLGTVAKLVADNSHSEETSIRMVSMPLGYVYPELSEVATPTGPRSLGWFRAVTQDPSKGVDFFPWWDAGQGADFFLGRAVCRMWQVVRWRPPITEEEGELLSDVHFDLERAHQLDPEGAIPWSEWQEIVDHLNDFFGYVEFQFEGELEPEIKRRAEAATPPTTRIGYRRGPVQAILTGGWSLVIPGSFAEEWEDDGQSWSAWLGGRTLWFSSWSVQDDNDKEQTAEAILDEQEYGEGEIIEHTGGDVIGRAVFRPHEEEGQQLWNLKAYSAVQGGFCLLNIYLSEEADLPWALEVWKGITN